MAYCESYCIATIDALDFFFQPRRKHGLVKLLEDVFTVASFFIDRQ